MKRKLTKDETGFGAAPNLDQEEFNKSQESLTEKQLDDQLDGLVELFRKKQQERSR